MRKICGRVLPLMVLVFVWLLPGTAFPAAPLDILLSNDDGFDALGIGALEKRLREAGHRVMVAAPRRNFSGSSVSLTRGSLRVEKKSAAVYVVAASPATCVLWGLEHFLREYGKAPDLVLSGINKGANLGPLIYISGTVGAATMAVLGLGTVPPIPAIAVSTDMRSPHNMDAINMGHYREVADFTTRLLGVLQAQRGQRPLLPQRMVLNVNYPPLPASKVRGVRLSEQGRNAPFRIAIKEQEGRYIPEFLAPEEGAVDGDVQAHQQGYITLVPLGFARTETDAGQLAFLRRVSGTLHP